MADRPSSNPKRRTAARPKAVKRRPRGSRALLHWRKTRRGERAIAKLRSFDGPGQIPRVLAYLRKVDPFVFEEILLSALEESGFRIRRNRRYTGDGGIDGKIEDADGNQVLLQAKRYAGHIRSRDVAALAALVREQEATYGVFIHTGRTGAGARYQRARRVRIVSGNHLVRLLLKPADTSIAGRGNGELPRSQ